MLILKQGAMTQPATVNWTGGLLVGRSSPAVCGLCTKREGITGTGADPGEVPAWAELRTPTPPISELLPSLSSFAAAAGNDLCWCSVAHPNPQLKLTSIIAAAGCHPKLSPKSYKQSSPFGPALGMQSSVFAIAFTVGPGGAAATCSSYTFAGPACTQCKCADGNRQCQPMC